MHRGRGSVDRLVAFPLASKHGHRVAADSAAHVPVVPVPVVTPTVPVVPVPVVTPTVPVVPVPVVTPTVPTTPVPVPVLTVIGGVMNPRLDSPWKQSC